MDVKDALRQLILTNYLLGERPENLTDDTALQSSGILDSLAVLAVATFAEKTYGVQFTATETMVDRFDSIDDIARLIAAKRHAAA